MKLLHFCKVLLLALSLGGGGCARVAPNGVSLPDEQTRCQEDADCELVSNTCSCLSGGVVVSVNSASAGEVRESLAVAACNSEISRDPGCGAAAATCDAGTCAFLLRDE
jgi:hypothetical protein